MTQPKILLFRVDEGVKALFDKGRQSTHLSDVSVSEESMRNGKEENKSSVQPLANNCWEMEEVKWRTRTDLSW